MNRSTYRFTLDLQKHRSQISIAVFQYDSAVRLYISLTDGGNPYRIEEGGRAVFYGKRPDDTPLCHNCMIDDTGRIIYDFNDQTASVEGITHCHINLYGKDGELITAPKFSIVAEERLVSDADIEKLEDSPLAALDEIQFAEMERVEAETARLTAEEARAGAETERAEAEAIRISNEAERVSNEAKRVANDDQRKKELADAVSKLNLKVAESVVGTISTHEKRITNLEQQINPSPFVTDDTTVYAKEVPARACPYAQIDKLNTASENPTKPLLGECEVNYPDTAMFENDEAYFSFETGGSDKTGWGSTDYCIGKFTAGDTSIDIYLDSEFNRVPNGTKLIFTEFFPEAEKWQIEANVMYTSDEVDEYGDPLVEEDVYIEAVDGVVTLYIESAGNNLVSLGSVTAYLEEDITLQASTEDLEAWRANHPDEDEAYFWQDVYDQVAISGYFEYPNVKVTALEMQGANLLLMPTKISSTSKGITATLNSDGTITVQGTATETGNFVHYLYNGSEPFELPVGTYSCFVGEDTQKSNLRYYFLYEDGSKLDIGNNVHKSFTTTQKITTLNAAIVHAITIGEYVEKTFYPMICEGSTAYPYGKYCRGTHTLWEIPEALRSLDDYGKEGAYIDLERRMLVYGENETRIAEYLPDDNFFDIEGAKSIIAVNEGNNPVSSSITFMLKEG